MTCGEILNKEHYMSESKQIVVAILDELCDKVININNNDHDYFKKENRKTCIIDDEIHLPIYYNNKTSRNRDSLYSLKEFDEEYDSNDNIKYIETHINEAINNELINDYHDKQNEKQKRKFSLNALFQRKKKSNDVTINNNNNIITRKYSSAVDVRDKSNLTRTSSSSSFRRKINDLQTDASNFIKRSFSLKEIVKKREKERSREKLSELKNREWAKSYQSLIETDISVKYDDMSFVNYYEFNNDRYDVTEKKKNLKRTQSLNVHVSGFRLFYFLF